MAFSLENHVAFADGVYFDDFVQEQTQKRRAFIYSARIEFLSDIRWYFSCKHAISNQHMTERRGEVSNSLITKFKKMWLCKPSMYIVRIILEYRKSVCYITTGGCVFVQYVVCMLLECALVRVHSNTICNYTVRTEKLWKFVLKCRYFSI